MLLCISQMKMCTITIATKVFGATVVCRLVYSNHCNRVVVGSGPLLCWYTLVLMRDHLTTLIKKLVIKCALYAIQAGHIWYLLYSSKYKFKWCKYFHNFYRLHLPLCSVLSVIPSLQIHMSISLFFQIFARDWKLLCTVFRMYLQCIQAL